MLKLLQLKPKIERLIEKLKEDSDAKELLKFCRDELNKLNLDE